MQNLPTAEVYEQEFKYFPWGRLISEVLEVVVAKAPKNGSLADLMCGTGYLLGLIHDRRPDLTLVGVDLEPEFISHANKQYPGIRFETADAFLWQSNIQYDLVVSTAGVHHLPYENQDSFIGKMKDLLKNDGVCICADPYVDDFSNEQERRLASARLGFEYLTETITEGAPNDIVQAAIGILSNDVLGVEYKTSLVKQMPIFKKHFFQVEMFKTWPIHKSEYGDYYFVMTDLS